MILNKEEKRQLEYLIWVVEEKLQRTTDEELIRLLKKQLIVWKNKLKTN